MAVLRSWSRGATRVTTAVALTGIALVALVETRIGSPTVAPAAPALPLPPPGDTATVYGPVVLSTPNGNATNHTESFSVSVIPGKRYILRLTNGNGSGGQKVTSGTVRLNGWETITSAELGSGNAFDRVVQARSADTLFATVQGTAGAYVTVSLLETGDASFIVLGPEHFVRTTGTPVTELRAFSLSPTAAPPYRLCLTNGAENGANRVSSATILMNNQEVFPPSNFNQQVASLMAQVTLQQANTLSVTLAGQPGGFVDICVTATDTTPPLLTITAPPQNFITGDTLVTVAGTVQDETPTTVTVNGLDAPVTGGGFSKVTLLPVEGHNTISIVATDRPGHVSVATRTVIRDTQDPILVVNQPANNTTTNQATIAVAGTVVDSTTVHVNLNGTVIPVTNGAFSSTYTLAEGLNQLVFVATDTVGNTSETVLRTVTFTTLPPNPSTVASVVNRAEATLMQENTSFLYTGATPIQTGVTDSIRFLRAAVVRGRVLNRQLQPLGGAVVKIKGHPELGQTLSRADGGYDLAVNGGGSLILDFSKSGYLPAQRTVAVPWQDYTNVDDVILVQPDPLVTTVSLTGQETDIQVARGSVQTDADSARQATVFFEPGTQATLQLPNGGGTVPLTSLNVRATEFTVGSHGDEAMPALLPPSSQYTYAVQITADSQLAVPGSKVTFNPPVPLYVENFLGFPVGTAVPVGAYDPDSATWLPRPNGVVVRIIGTDAQGRATMDINGDGIADSDALLLVNGIDSLERVKLAGTFPLDSRLWRVPIIEGLPNDLNWPFTLLGGDEPKTRITGPCGSEGADVLRCNLQVQTAFQSVGIVGSPFSLNYASDRTQGNLADRQLKIDLVGATIPAFLQRVDLEINVAGRLFETSFSPAANLSYTFTWDGKDVYGRTVQSTQPAVVRVGYLYPVVYSRPAAAAQSFGQPCTLTSGDCTLDSIPPIQDSVRALRRVWEGLQTTIGGFDAAGVGLGGFTVDVQHAYDPIGGMLYSGDGTRRVAATLPEQITRWAGTGSTGFASPPPVNGVHRLAGNPGGIVGNPAGIVVLPDGSVIIADPFRGRVVKVGTNDTASVVAGTGVGGFNGDSGTATARQLSNAVGIGLGSDGSLYIADQNNHRIRQVTPQGFMRTIAGDGTCGFLGDGGPAKTARICQPAGLAVAPDGSIYFADAGNVRIRRIGPDLRISTVAGLGTATQCFLAGSGSWTAPPLQDYINICKDGGPAVRAPIRLPNVVAVGPDGSVYFGQGVGGKFDARIRRIDPSGIIRTVVGSDHGAPPVPLTNGDGGPALQARLTAVWSIGIGPDGSIYYSDEGSELLVGGVPQPGTGQYRVRRVRPDGLIQTVVGDGVAGNTGDNGPARRARVQRVEGIAFMQDGSMLISDDAKVRKVSPPLPGLAGGQTAIASENGREIYVFSAAGRLLMTLDAANRDTVFLYAYNSQRQLVSITDRNGRITTIERDANGRVTGVVTPDGQRTQTVVDPATGLTAVTDPYSVTQNYQYSGTLMTGATTPQGGTTQYSYDALGQVSGNTSPTGDASQLTTIANGVSFQSAFGATAQLTAVGSAADGFSQSLVMPNGKPLQVTVDADGRRVTVALDGTKTTESQLPDPRLGLQAPLNQVTIVTPAGRTNVQRQGRALVLADTLDPLSVVTKTDSFFVNGRVYTDFFEKSLRRLTTKTPALRQAQTVSDTLGRVVQMTLPGLTTFVMTYDAGGRMITKTQGARSQSFGHDSLGRRIRNTDALGRSTLFGYNSAGQLATRTLPDGRVVTLGFDQNGNVTAVTPPGRPTHHFVYDSSDRARAYVPPLVGSSADTISLSYNVDGKLARIAGPDGDTTLFAFDTTGRRRSVTQPDGLWTYSYDSTGYLNQSVAPGMTKTYSYDGMLLTSIAASGSAPGTVSYSYDNDFRVSQETVNGGFSVSRQYDPDGLPTVIGAIALTRNATHGLVSATSIGSVTTANQYSAFGETSDFRALWNSDTLYHAVYGRDAGGRITTLTETIGGQTSTYGFVYDTAGRLGTMNVNGQPSLSFGYDSSGNRTSLTSSGGTVLGSYDAQDRVASYGSATYTFSRRGDLAKKVVGSDTTRYHFDAFGNLRTVSMADGRQIEYVVDGEGRRVAAKLNGSVVAGYLYDDRARIVAQLDGVGSVVARFVYASKAHVPDYMVRGGQTYRFISDHVGSVRLVVDVASGAVAQRIDYDPFGRVLANTNPGFQPFGFVGGLFDDATGLTRRGQREYDGQTGRWVTRDQLLFEGGSSNLYCYAGDDPINGLDAGGGMGLLTEQMVVMEIVSIVTMIRKIYKEIKEEVGGPLKEFAKSDEIRRANEASQALSAGFDEWAADGDVGGKSEDELAYMMEAYQHQVFIAAQAGAIAAGKAYMGAIKVLFGKLKEHRLEERQKCGALAYFWGDGWDPAVDHSNYGRGRGNWNLDSRSQMNKLCSEWGGPVQ